MRYDKFWVFGLFLVISLWAQVLIFILGYIIVPRNVLLNRDVFTPILAALSFNLVYIFLGAIIFKTYISKIKKLKQNHQMIRAKKGHFNDQCSIVVPGRDEEAVIKRAVLKWLQQTYQNIEILVVALNSSDRTYQEAQVDDKMVGAFNLRTKASGKAVALNSAIEQSRGKYVLILDSDTILEDDFVENATPALGDGEYVAVQWRVLLINRGYNFLTRMMAMEDDFWQEPIMTTRTIFGERCPLLGTGFIIRKDTVAQEGNFANSLVDDHELTRKLLKKKYRIIYLPYCKAYAEEPPSVEVMIRQRARWDRGFINSLNRRMADSRDIIGNFSWLMGLGSFAGSIMFIIVVYATIYSLILEYLSYNFAYLPLLLWSLVAGVMVGLDFSVLLKVSGIKDGLRHAVYLLPFIAFSQNGLVVLYKALFVRTWGTTKTVHGFTERAGTTLTSTTLTIEQRLKK